MSRDASAQQLFVGNTIRRAGIEALDWVLRFAQDLDPESPEYGGIRTMYNPMRREFPRAKQGWLPQEGQGLCLTWSACVAAFASMAAYDLTGDPFYLDRTKMIGEFVKKNQNLDSSDKVRYGTFVVSQGRKFVDVPDASWAGDLFVHLYRRTGDKDYLDRARVAADWLIERAHMSHGGFATFYMLDTAQPVSYSHGSDGQHGIFLANLFQETKDERYRKPLVPLADMLSGIGQHESGAYYGSVRADGTPVYEGWDEDTSRPLMDGIERVITGPRQNYYAARFLIEQYRRDGNRRYLESARRCVDFTLDTFRRDGYLSDWLTFENGRWVPNGYPDAASPSATTLVLLALTQAEDDPRWLEACLELSEWSVRWQCHQPDYPDLHGAIMMQPFMVIAFSFSFAAWGLLEMARFLQSGQSRTASDPKRKGTSGRKATGATKQTGR
jgi:hypothetical protein